MTMRLRVYAVAATMAMCLCACRQSSVGSSATSTAANASVTALPAAAAANSDSHSVAVQGVAVVDLIPASMSEEDNQDSEPFLAVNAGNPQWMVASAFTKDPAGEGSPSAPLFVSVDAGATWELASVLPSPVWTSDITHAFDGQQRHFYSGILRRSDGNLMALMTTDFSSPALMTTQASRPDDDQPFVRATATPTGSAIYIGNNDTSRSLQDGRTATVDVSLDGGAHYNSVRLEGRQAADISSCLGRSARQDGPSVRPALASDGTVYAAYFGWRSFQGDCWHANVRSDLVVVRDDHRAAGATPFEDLKDPVDGVRGVRVMTDLSIPWSNDSTLGFERIGSTLSLAVDPSNSAHVIVAWGDRTNPDDIYSLHVRSSTDRGRSWSAHDLWSAHDASSVAVALADSGTVGILYQEYAHAVSQRPRWETHLVQTSDNFATTQDLVLATFDAEGPKPQFLPYLGDYLSLAAFGTEFRGVFSSSNNPDPADFPQGVSYLRRVDWTRHVLDPGSAEPVAVSIDPFYVRAPVKH